MILKIIAFTNILYSLIIYKTIILHDTKLRHDRERTSISLATSVYERVF